MKPTTIKQTCAAILFLAMSRIAPAAIVVSTFEEPELAAKLNGFQVYEGETEAASTFRSGHVTFHNDGVFFNGSTWSGVGISRKSVRTAPNFYDEGDDLISKPLTGSGSQTWGVVYAEGVVIADSGSRFLSVDVANTLWDFDTMQNGDPFVGPPLGDGGGTGRFAGQDDFFVVQFTNPATSQTLQYSLADFRGATDFIRENWSSVDLSSLNASELSITLLGSRETSFDGGLTYFPDLPTYVAIDNLAVTVPEPHSLAALMGFIAGLYRRRRAV